MFKAQPLHSFQADDPTNSEMGAGAGSNFQGDRDAARNFRDTSGVVEGRPGIIESSNIDPLNERSNDGTSRFFISLLFFCSIVWMVDPILFVHSQTMAGQTLAAAAPTRTTQARRSPPATRTHTLEMRSRLPP
jgi:hypothetical protein